MGGLRQRLADGEVLVGTFIQTPHPVVCEFLGRNFGLDLLCLEGEHSAMGVETVHGLLTAIDAAGLPSVVRVADNDWVHLAQALDGGATGVIAPRVNSAEEARRLVRATRYPPAGDRGIGPGRVTRYGPDSGPDYRARANEDVLVAAQVETAASVADLERILEVDGLDMVFVGPMDLGSSLGLAPNTPELEAVIEDILGKTRAAGRAAGIFAPNPALAARWMGSGVQLVLLSSDLGLMAAGVTQALEALPGRGG